MQVLPPILSKIFPFSGIFSKFRIFLFFGIASSVSLFGNLCFPFILKSDGSLHTFGLMIRQLGMDKTKTTLPNSCFRVLKLPPDIATPYSQIGWITPYFGIITDNWEMVQQQNTPTKFLLPGSLKLQQVLPLTYFKSDGSSILLANYGQLGDGTQPTKHTHSNPCFRVLKLPRISATLFLSRMDPSILLAK